MSDTALTTDSISEISRDRWFQLLGAFDDLACAVIRELPPSEQSGWIRHLTRLRREAPLTHVIDVTKETTNGIACKSC